MTRSRAGLYYWAACSPQARPRRIRRSAARSRGAPRRPRAVRLAALMKSRRSEDHQLDLGIGNPPAVSTEAQVACRQCGGRFVTPAWYAARKVELRFCSPACRLAWTRGNEGERVKPAPRRDRRGANWKIQSRLARERDGYQCRECGIAERQLGRQLDVHHRIPFRHFKSNVEANKLEHLISLCPSCHKRLEARMRQELPLFTG